MFQQMQQQGLTPDVVTYTAVISAYEKGGQWRLALGAYEQMRERGCRPDAIVFNAIIDALWETGVIWAQRKVPRLRASEPLDYLMCSKLQYLDLNRLLNRIGGSRPGIWGFNSGT